MKQSLSRQHKWAGLTCYELNSSLGLNILIYKRSPIFYSSFEATLDEKRAGYDYMQRPMLHSQCLVSGNLQDGIISILTLVYSTCNVRKKSWVASTSLLFALSEPIKLVKNHSNLLFTVSGLTSLHKPERNWGLCRLPQVDKSRGWFLLFIPVVGGELQVVVVTVEIFKSCQSQTGWIWRIRRKNTEG